MNEDQTTPPNDPRYSNSVRPVAEDTDLGAFFKGLERGYTNPMHNVTPRPKPIIGRPILYPEPRKKPRQR
jgi:hypothetical protein